MNDPLPMADDEGALSVIIGKVWNEVVRRLEYLSGTFEDSGIPYYDGHSGIHFLQNDFEWGLFRLRGSLTRSGSADADEMGWDGSQLFATSSPIQTVYGDFTRGYHFSGDDVWVAELYGRLFVVTPGHFQVRGTLDGTLTSGGTATLSVTTLDGSSNWADDESKNVTVTEAIGLDADVDAGTVVLATWHEQGQIWIPTNAPCPPAASS